LWPAAEQFGVAIIPKLLGAGVIENLRRVGMPAPEDITFFSAVDRTKEPDFFRRFLDEGNKLPDIISSKPVILAGLQLTGGERVLDLGCGLGDDTFAIARLVGGQGHAIGVDVS
jgi:SAM-dependent methyltransferase